MSSSQTGKIEAVDDLRGSAGRLEALLNRGEEQPKYAAVVCHPHPPSGGTMHTKVVYHAAKALNAFGYPVLRFNFRGVGTSEGAYTNGPGEIEDVRAAVDWVAEKYKLPVILAGFSFGSNVALRASISDDRIVGLIGMGVPLEAGGRKYTYEFIKDCLPPKLFVTGAQDPFAPRVVMEAMMASAPPPVEAVWVDGADHFFFGTPESPVAKLPELRSAIEKWVAARFA